MRRLVDDLLDVSRIVQGKLEIRSRPVNLRLVVERALEAVHPAILAHRCAMQVNAERDVWVNGDETRLIQVVVNLLTNALRFGRDGDVALSLWEFAGQGHITVRDHGVGMNFETAAHVFERFYQAPQSLARSSGGLGLGLAIVHSIVELHGGKVSAASAGLNQGSSFEVCLPVIGAPRSAGAQDDAGALQRSRARLLVVDDNVDAATSMAQLLRMAGHEVEVAHDGEAALAVFASTLPQLALLDIGLPGMDGYALAEALRAANPAWHGKLVALTGYGQQADRLRSAQAGFDLHLTKPVDAPDLLGALERLLAQDALAQRH
jgi:CheY-like chemotaxis protein